MTLTLHKTDVRSVSRHQRIVCFECSVKVVSGVVRFDVPKCRTLHKGSLILSCSTCGEAMSAQLTSRCTRNPNRRRVSQGAQDAVSGGLVRVVGPENSKTLPWLWVRPENVSSPDSPAEKHIMCALNAGLLLALASCQISRIRLNLGERSNIFQKSRQVKRGPPTGHGESPINPKASSLF